MEPTPAMLSRGASVLRRATGNSETIAHDVWQAMLDEWQHAYQAPRTTEFDGNTVKYDKFIALIDELTDANMELHAAHAEIERLRGVIREVKELI